MKLSELRKMAALAGSDVGAFHHSFGSAQAAELATDIDQAIENAKHIAYADGYQAGCGHTNVPSADGWDYRKAVRTGWNGAINRMHEIFPVYGHVLDEMRQANDVPQVNPAYPGAPYPGAPFADPPKTGTRAVPENYDEQTALKCWMNRVLRLEQRGQGVCGRVTAPADSELGVELSKIRDRLNVLENGWKEHQRLYEAVQSRHVEHAKWHEVTEFGERITALENWKVARLEWESNEAAKVLALQDETGNLRKWVNAINSWRMALPDFLPSTKVTR